MDEAFFMGGARKDRVLEAFRPHIFFDDQHVHCEDAAHVAPTARVSYPAEESVSNQDTFSETAIEARADSGILASAT